MPLFESIRKRPTHHINFQTFEHKRMQFYLWSPLGPLALLSFPSFSLSSAGTYLHYLQSCQIFCANFFLLSFSFNTLSLLLPLIASSIHFQLLVNILPWHIMQTALLECLSLWLSLFSFELHCFCVFGLFVKVCYVRMCRSASDLFSCSLVHYFDFWCR